MCHVGLPVCPSLHVGATLLCHDDGENLWLVMSPCEQEPGALLQSEKGVMQASATKQEKVEL